MDNLIIEQYRNLLNEGVYPDPKTLSSLLADHGASASHSMIEFVLVTNAHNLCLENDSLRVRLKSLQKSAQNKLSNHNSDTALSVQTDLIATKDEIIKVTNECKTLAQTNLILEAQLAETKNRLLQAEKQAINIPNQDASMEPEPESDNVLSLNFEQRKSKSLKNHRT